MLDKLQAEQVEKDDDTTLASVISRYDLIGTSKSAENREKWTDTQVLTNSSGGLTLRGILWGSSFEIKRTVLSTPEDVKLVNPLILCETKLVEHSSKSQQDRFERVLQTMGHSAAADVKVAGLGGAAGVGISRAYEWETITESKSHKQSTFCSQVKYTIVPTAACELNPRDLRLAKPAVFELQQIEKNMLSNFDSKLIRKQCGDFLQNYGSHVNAGTIHFGGVTKFTATYFSEGRLYRNKASSMVRDSLNAYASAAGSCFGVNVGASGSVDSATSSAYSSATYDKSEQSKVDLYTSYNGGPYNVTNPNRWREGLIESNCTWAVIDRGKCSRDFVGIWDLISNHEEFAKPKPLRLYLKRAWEKIDDASESNKLSFWERMRANLGLFGAQYEAIADIEPELEVLLSNQTMEVKGVPLLERLLCAVEHGTDMHDWGNALRESDTFSAFLVSIVEQKEQFENEDICKMKYLLRKDNS